MKNVIVISINTTVTVFLFGNNNAAWRNEELRISLTIDQEQKRKLFRSSCTGNLKQKKAARKVVNGFLPPAYKFTFCLQQIFPILEKNMKKV